ncbi:aspartate--tRNA ligase [Candidatus Marinamargulisbacteria bacterium SCGC AG-414-C22]|nr:aspartate--tRNA ligase [Candidatus Marinamargulisbacteria bacterium SCGC AG-414-C22]
MDWKNRFYCGSFTLADVGKTVTSYGWVDTIRDHGQLLFAHLRDVTGIVQLVFNPEDDQAVYQTATTLRNEFCVQITGTIVERSDEAKNAAVPTGAIECHVSEITIFSSAETPPFVLTEKSKVDDDASDFNVDEDIRLKYRYLDLRRPSMQQAMLNRSKIIKTIRRYLDDNHFNDIETPVLTKSTPEGARDYLVPSRHHSNKFYALPQSPQMFKQLLMISGFDKYYQIVKCFRDEDLRPNRQPEFTQLDLEASFIDESYIYHLFEPLITDVFGLVGKTVSGPFPHITYDEAMNKYGNDHPDLRFDMTMIDVTDVLKDVEYRIFNSIVSSGGSIKGINVKGRSEHMSKNMLQEELAKKVVPSFGGKGMSWMKVENGALVSNIVQFFKPHEQEALIKAMNGEDGDVFLFIADTNKELVNDVLGRLRLYVGEKQGFIDNSKIAACWVTEFPMFELKDGRLSSMHHPFTQPGEGIETATTTEDFLALKSRAYDLVINGEEVGGGSIRIHDPKMQSKIFTALGLSDADIKEKFGFFVDALKYGTPPHGGIALGIDRLACMVNGLSSIREVIAFPKNRVAFCPLTEAPSGVDSAQLDELYLNLITPPED